MAGLFTIGIFGFAFFLLFFHDAEWIPESIQLILRKIGVWIWSIIFIGMVIEAIFTPPWLRYS